MAKNESSSTYEGRHQTVRMAYVSSGDMVLVGDDGLHGVALIDTNAQGNTVIDIAGRWYLPIENENISIGDALYCDANGGTLSKDPDHGTFFGYALEEYAAAGSGATICVLVVQDHIPGDEEILLDMLERGDEVEALIDAGGGIAALLAAGLGNSVALPKTSDGIVDLLAAGIGVNAVVVVAVVTQAFANGDGGQPTFAIGDETTANKFFATGAFTNATLGTVLISAGLTVSAEKVRATCVKATGTTSTGALAVTVLGLPAA